MCACQSTQRCDKRKPWSCALEASLIMWYLKAHPPPFPHPQPPPTPPHTPWVIGAGVILWLYPIFDISLSRRILLSPSSHLASPHIITTRHGLLTAPTSSRISSTHLHPTSHHYLSLSSQARCTSWITRSVSADRRGLIWRICWLTPPYTMLTVSQVQWAISNVTRNCRSVIY